MKRKSKLIRLKMLEYDMTVAQLANRLNLSASALQMKLNKKREFKVNEAVEIMDIFNIDYAKIKDYFF